MTESADINETCARAQTPRGGHKTNASWVIRGGGEETRKMIVAAVVACMFVFVSALSVPAVRAERPLVCTAEVDLASPTSWAGTVTGDVIGSIVILENPATYVGTTEHFDESWAITTTDGVVIKGYDLGVFGLKTLKAVANGMVTDVDSADWQWLVGYQVHMTAIATVTDTGGMTASVNMMLMAP